jgi:DNA-binding transcriptional LysR family regulator
MVLEEQHRRRGWEAQLLSSERLALIAPRGHELLQQEQAPAGLLRQKPLILPRNGTPLRRLIEENLRRRGVTAADLHVVLETDSVTFMMQAVRTGLGMAFVPQALLARTRDIGIVDLAGLNLQQEWYAIRSRERGVQRAVQELYYFVVSPEARALLAREGWKVPVDA